MERKREEDGEGEVQWSQKAKQGGTSYRLEDTVPAPQAQATTLFLVISNRRDEGSSPSLADLSRQQLLKP